VAVTVPMALIELEVEVVAVGVTWFWHCVRKNGSYLVLEWILLVLTICFWFLLGSGMVLTGFDNLILVLTRPQNGSYWA
jgi:hypothetical protein